MPNRMISLERNTNETQIDLTLDLDGTGRYEVDTGCGFLNHMLELFARHGRFDLVLTCHGRYGAVGVADVELVGGVVDGGRDIEFLLVHWCFPLFCPRRMKAGRNYLQSTTERAVFARFYRIFPQKKKVRRHKHRTFSI